MAGFSESGRAAPTLIAWGLGMLLLGVTAHSPLPALRVAYLVIVIASVVVALGVATDHFVRLLRRIRWLCVSVVGLMTWATPGLAIPWLPGATYEGVQLAAGQLAEIVAAVAMVSVLLSRMSAHEFIAALTALVAPLRWFGFPVERFAIRVRLTFDYAQTRPGHPATLLSLLANDNPALRSRT